MRRTIVVAMAVAVLAVGTVAGWYAWRDSPASPPATEPPATTPITRQNLTAATVVDAELGYGTPSPIASAATGTVTWLPAVGSTVRRGEPLLLANESPVILLYGNVPMYRTLTANVEGRDVAQFEKNLQALGYKGFTVDSEYSSATAVAVRTWQRRLGVPETGEVEPGRVVVAPGPVRITSHEVRLGGSPTGDVLTVTGLDLVVTATVDGQAELWTATGTAVGVMLPDGMVVAGRISKVEDAKEAGKVVTVTVADQAALGQAGTVRIRHVVAEARDVLTVPVVALVARPTGGYAVEVLRDNGIEIVPVEVGLFAEGRVEIRGAGLEAGALVGVPE